MPINLAILQSRQSISPPLSISPYVTTNGALRSLKRTRTLTVGELLLVRGAPMLYGRGRLCSSEGRRYRSEGRYRRPSATGRVRDVWFLVQGRHYRREGRYFSSEGLCCCLEPLLAVCGRLVKGGSYSRKGAYCWLRGRLFWLEGRCLAEEATLMTALLTLMNSVNDGA